MLTASPPQETSLVISIRAVFSGSWKNNRGDLFSVMEISSLSPEEEISTISQERSRFAGIFSSLSATIRWLLIDIMIFEVHAFIIGIYISPIRRNEGAGMVSFSCLNQAAGTHYESVCLFGCTVFIKFRFTFSSNAIGSTRKSCKNAVTGTVRKISA